MIEHELCCRKTKIKAVLDLLKRDGDIPYRVIAQKLGISQTTAYECVKEIKKEYTLKLIKRDNDD